jgi:hypothetical protein
MAIVYLGDTASGSSSSLTGVPLDDAWIHFNYAKNFFRHGPFTYNPGDFQTGSSSPLWTLVLAVFHLVPNVSIVVTAKALGMAMHIGSSVLVYAIARRILGHHLLALAALLFWALHPHLAYFMFSGMEVSLSVLLTLLLIWRSLEDAPPVELGVLSGLTVLARPENVVVTLVAGLVLLARRPRRAAVLAYPGAALVVLSPWLLYAWAVSGSVLPSTAGKLHPMTVGGEQWTKLWGYISHHPLLSSPLLAALMLAGLASGMKHLGTERRPRLFLLVPLLIIPAFLCVHTIPTTFNPYDTRYTAILEPYYMLALLMGLESVRVLVRDRAPLRRTFQRALGIAAGLLLLLFAAALVIENLVLADRLSWDTASIDRQHVAVGKWIATNLPATATVGVNDAGAIAYFSRSTQRVRDLFGLNNLALERAYADPYEFMKREEIRYLAIYEPWFPELREHAVVVERFKTTLLHNTSAGHHTLTVFEVVRYLPE